MTLTPHRTENGVSHSNQPPAYWRSTTVTPCRTAPSATPCMNDAATDPPTKPASQSRARRALRNRNSNATPRNTRPSSMIMIGA